MKHVHKYASSAEALAVEAVDDLTDADVQTLRGELARIGWGQWNQWLIGHSQDIREYMRATSSQRHKRKGWQAERPFLAYAAYLECHHAAALLRTMDDPALLPGGSYRDMAADASALYWKLMLPDFEIWPFDLESPFCE